MKTHKVVEFDIRHMIPIGLTFVIFGISIAYGLNVLGDVRDDMPTGSPEQNATNYTISGVSKLPEKLPMIATVIVAVIIIGILVRYLMVRV